MEELTMSKEEAEENVKTAAAARDRTKNELLIARRAAEHADAALNDALRSLARFLK
jgi:hypothetical protein